MDKKILIANIICIIAIVVLGYLTLFTTSVKPPETIDIKETPKPELIESETTYNPAQNTPDIKDDFPNLGKVSIIRTLFTPTPTPPPRKPTPTRPPSINKIIQDWALQGIFGQECFLENRKTKEEIRASQGETIDMAYRNDTVQVKVVEVNGDQNYVVFEAFGYTKKMTLF